MRIDYPEIDWSEARPGDTLLSHQEQLGCTNYVEFTVPQVKVGTPAPGTLYYLIERPEPTFPTTPGSFILAKRVRDRSFPEGLALVRAESNASLWISHGTKVNGVYTHSEHDIEYWVPAKVVPA